MAYPNYSNFNNFQQFPQYQPQYQPMQQSYQPQNLYQQIPQAQSKSIAGMYVDSVDVVKATPADMSGNAVFFPKTDFSEVYMKQLMPNGESRILTYKPILENNPNNSTKSTEKLKFDLSDDATKAFMERFDSIESAIAKLSVVKAAPKAKKESEE